MSYSTRAAKSIPKIIMNYKNYRYMLILFMYMYMVHANSMLPVKKSKLCGNILRHTGNARSSSLPIEGTCRNLSPAFVSPKGWGPILAPKKIYPLEPANSPPTKYLRCNPHHYAISICYFSRCLPVKTHKFKQGIKLWKCLYYLNDTKR